MDNNNLWQDFFNQYSDGIVLFRADGKIIGWNFEMEKITGISSSYSINQYWWDLQFEMLPKSLRLSCFKKELKQQFNKTLELLEFEDKIAIEQHISDKSDNISTHLNTITKLNINQEKVYCASFQNILPSKQLFNDLLVSEQKYSSSFYDNPCPMLICLFSNWQIIETNHSLEQHKILSKLFYKEQIITSISNVISAKDLKKILNLLIESRRVERYPLTLRNGQTHSHYLLSAHKITINCEELVFFAVLDITHEKKLQKELLENEKRYKAIYENSMMGIVILNPKLQIIQANELFCQMSGQNEIELKKQKIVDLLHPVKIDEGKVFFERAFNSSENISNFQELEIIDLNGTIRQVNSYLCSYYDENIGSDALIALFDDISVEKKIAEELIKSEQKYRMIADFVLDVIWILDLNFVCTFVSPSIYKFQGYTTTEFLKLQQSDYFTANSLHLLTEKLSQYYGQILAGECRASELKATMELEYLHKKGSIVHGEVTIVFISDSKGNPTGLLGVTRDVTERKQSEANILLAKEKAEEANRIKSLFLANVSHEIRTPVSGIIGLTTRLIKHAESQFMQKQLNSIHNSAEMLLAIINDLLDVSRIEAGKLGLENIEFDFRKMLSGVTDLFTHRLLEKKLYFHYAIDGNIPKFVQGDPVRIGQILINILGNAIKFTEKGGVELTVKELTVKKGDKYGIGFIIKDTGSGISPDKLKSIFEAFTQADISHTRKYGGTGLGLTISSKLIEMMGGEINVESVINKGSVFEYSIYLDLIESCTKNVTESTQIDKINLNLFKNLKIIIADDNEINREYLKMLLEEYSVKVISCANGEECYQQYIQNSDIDGLILDIQMPKMDGYQVASAVRKSSNDNLLPILGLSASGYMEEEKLSINAGMNQFMIKPVKEERILSWLNTILGVKANQDIASSLEVDELTNQIEVEINDLLLRNKNRLSSLLPLVELMISSGKLIVEELKTLAFSKEYQKLREATHKFKGRISIFETGKLFLLLNQLERKIVENLIDDLDFELVINEIERSYITFSQKMEKLKEVIIEQLSH